MPSTPRGPGETPREPRSTPSKDPTMPLDDDARESGRARNDEPDWDAMFASQPEPSTGAGERMTRGGETPPPSRRARRASGGTSRGGKRWIAWLVALLVVLGLGGGAVAFVWLNFEEQ